MEEDNQNNHQSKTTTDHEEIKRWVEERDGHPAMVSTTHEGGGGILRIDFGEQEENLDPVSWEEFFQVFDDRKLAFLYQDETAGGEKSYFFKFVERE